MLQQISVPDKSTGCQKGWLRTCSPVSLPLYKMDCSLRTKGEHVMMEMFCLPAAASTRSCSFCSCFFLIGVTFKA